jgi:ubiquinone/menaquinone biosynthesis C-methylase UbiE
VLLDHVPLSIKTILDLGTGDGRLLALLRIDRPRINAVALDFSQPMVEMARKRFADDPLIKWSLTTSIILFQS